MRTLGFIKKSFVYFLLIASILVLVVLFGSRSKTENVGNANFICFWDGFKTTIQFDVTRTRTWNMWIFKASDKYDFNRGGLHPEGCYCEKLDVYGKCEWY